LSSASSRIRWIFSRVAGSLFKRSMKRRTKASKRSRSSCSRSRLTSDTFFSATSTIFSSRALVELQAEHLVDGAQPGSGELFRTSSAMKRRVALAREKLVEPRERLVEKRVVALVFG
jgi:hypothetical protein